MTALPIIETLEGEISAYIPTNLISITDGQIFLDRNTFAAGQRPAIDIAVSVSRIGGRTQHPAIKREAGRMKLDYLQFLELEVFTRFGARLEASVEKAIRRGRVLRSLLRQNRLSPTSPLLDLVWLIAFNDGRFDEIEPERTATLLEGLESGLEGSELTLETPRDELSRHISEWFDSHAGESP
jgi:F-type H+-transporting ATPase subunit alpha